ncbi:Hypothetical protein NCS54_01238900 [Fusarium falciforme]|uniref:Hypothetical protein n=1 Tax=Fusarium falciforme TaxID=195108 RepID=UPI0023010BD6|nr:Hypothetical protein NCS54_01238900 [Fusarium falciforme]WAO94789.1 Hypothetical protein NCS54_01238900 [Fusarium falciforme]
MAANTASSAHSTAVPPLATMAHPTSPALTTFHIFPKFPQEIQDKIWAFAIDVDSPRGYNVGFTATPIAPGSTTIRWGLRKIRQQHTPRIGPNETTRNVMATGLAGAGVAKLQWRLWRPEVPFRLEDRSNVGDPMSLIKAESPTAPRIKVDAAKDLMVIPNIGRSKKNDNITEIYLPHELVAHHSDCSLPGAPGELTYRLKNMLPLCPDIRVLYIVIHNFQGSQSKPLAEDFEATAGHILEWYKQELKDLEPQTSSATYPLGDRIYYEIKPEQFPRTDEFSRLLQDISEVKGWHRGEYPNRQQRLAFRVMTWRYA